MAFNVMHYSSTAGFKRVCYSLKIQHKQPTGNRNSETKLYSASRLLSAWLIYTPK